MELGMDVQQIGLYGTLGYVASLAAYLLFNFFKPKDGSYLKPMFFAALCLILSPLMLILAGLVPKLLLLTIAGNALYQFMLGFRGSCDYSVVPTIFPRSHYGVLSSKCGMIGSGLAALVSMLTASLTTGGNSLSGYMTIFVAAAAAMSISALAMKGYRPHPVQDSVKRLERKGGKLTWQTAWMLLPHLLRGIANGGFYYFVVVSLEKVTLTASLSSLIVTVGVLGAMAGCFLFMKLEKHMTTGRLILIGCVLCGMCAFLTTFNSLPVLFFALYFGYMAFKNIVDYAIPAGVMYSTPIEQLPFISSMRMLMTSGGVTVFIQVFSNMLSVVPSWTVMLISAAVFAAAGVIFRIQYTDALKA
jgi:MFS family permease